MIWPLLTTVIAVVVRGATTATAGPSGCVSFDVHWNLLAFGFNGKDYNVGTQDTWTSTSECSFLGRWLWLTVTRFPDGHHDARTPVGPSSFYECFLLNEMNGIML